MRDKICRDIITSDVIESNIRFGNIRKISSKRAISSKRVDIEWYLRVCFSDLSTFLIARPVVKSSERRDYEDAL